MVQDSDRVDELHLKEGKHGQVGAQDDGTGKKRWGRQNKRKGGMWDRAVLLEGMKEE